MTTGVVNFHSVGSGFRVYNSDDDSYLDRTALRDFVRHWKAILIEKHNMQPGQTIGIGFPLTDIYYFGLVLAATDLGLRLVVLDISNNHVINNANPKVQEFMPMDLFVSGRCLEADKDTYYRNLARKSDIWTVWDTYAVQNAATWHDVDQTQASQDDTLLLCTSSGTTDRPKRVEHSHAFLQAVSQRNCDLWRFQGRVVHVRNLHHGSSLATYFLPAIMSDRCEAHYVYNVPDAESVPGLVRFCHQHDINHCQLPYVSYITDFLQTAVNEGLEFSDLTIYTLGYIIPEWQHQLRHLGRVTIVSVFGCNETSGPIFTNQLTANTESFDPQAFEQCDDFYDLGMNDQNQLTVQLPMYQDRVIVMQDAFDVQGTRYRHLGRNDLVRINDIELDVFWLLTLTQQLELPAQITVDRNLERLYLAVWDSKSDTAVIQHQVQQALHAKYGTSLHIWQTQSLCMTDYMFGTKLDHELLRNKFRSHHASTS